MFMCMRGYRFCVPHAGRPSDVNLFPPGLFLSPQLYFPSGSLSLSSSKMFTSTLACIVKGRLLLITCDKTGRKQNKTT